MKIGRNYVSIVVTIISNITVLVPDNFICFGYFMPLSHDVNKKAPTIFFLQPSPLPGFHQVCLLIYKKYFINPFLLWSNKLLQKIMLFQNKAKFFFQLTASRFSFWCFVYMYFLGHFFTALSSWNCEWLHVCIYA